MNDRIWTEDELAEREHLLGLSTSVLCAVLMEDVAWSLQAVFEHGNTAACLLGAEVLTIDEDLRGMGAGIHDAFRLRLRDGREFRVTFSAVEPAAVPDPEPDVSDEGFNSYIGQYDHDC